MSAKDAKRRLEFGIQSIIPSDWFKGPQGSSVWVAAFKMYRVPNESIPAGRIIVDLKGVRIALVYGSLPYLDSRKANPTITDDGEFTIDPSGLETTSPEGAYLLLLVPFEVDGKPGDEQATLQLISTVVGLLAAFEYRNIVYERVFDNTHQLGKAERSVIGQTIVNPFSLPAPNLNEQRLREIVEADKRISQLSETERARIQLSLRWFESAVYDTDIDAFLKFWIALETLAMPDTTNIRPINDALALAYKSSVQDVAQAYHVGRLYNLRSRIVHAGLKASITSHLLDYIAAIYVDVLFQALGVSCENRTRKIIIDRSIDPVELIPEG